VPHVVGDLKRDVGPDDKQPIGYIFTDGDGITWKKMKSATPFGVAIYYERQ
jgi:hypothetical protein